MQVSDAFHAVPFFSSWATACDISDDNGEARSINTVANIAMVTRTVSRQNEKNVMAAPFNLVFQLVSKFILNTGDLNRLAIDYPRLVLKLCRGLDGSSLKDPFG